MIIECESCKAKFRLDDSKIPDKGIKVRCSKCKHAFFVKKPAPMEEKELPEPPAEEVSRADEQQIDSEFEKVEEKKREEAPYEATVKIDLAAQKELTFDEEEKFIEEKAVAESKKKISMPFLIILIVLGVIVSLGAAAYFTGMVDQFIGPPETPISPLKVSKLEGDFAEGLNAQKVFIIKGMVTNESKKARRFIRVKGIIFDKKGKPVLQKFAYCGNLIPSKDLKTKARGEIEKMMQKKDATKILRKGGGLRFMVALYDLPKDISEYSAEIVSAEIIK